MKKRKKQFIALGLSFIMMVSMLAGCSLGNPDVSDTTGSNSDTSRTDAAGNSKEEGTSVEEEIEEVTLTVYIVSADENAMTGGIQTDPVAEYIREKTGVTLDITVMDTDKTSAIVASGDLYDLNILSSTDYIDPLIKTGALADLDDYLQYAPYLTENYSSLLAYSREYLSADTGRLYILPERAKSEASPVATSQNGFFVRWDYYVEAGSPEINSEEDYLDLLETIQKNHPKTEDGKNAYALATFVDWGTFGFYWYNVYSKYKGLGNYGSLSTYSLKDLTFYDLYDDMNLYWQQANLLYKANQRGILDPESFTQNHDTIIQKLSEGRLLSSPLQWEIGSISAALDSGSSFVDIPFADTEEYPAWVDRISPFGYTARMVFVSSKCDDAKMKAIMRLLNFVYSEEGSRIIMNGVPDVNWTYDDNGSAIWVEEALTKMQTEANYSSEQGMNKYLGMIGQDYDAFGADGKFIDLRLQADYLSASLTDAEVAYCQHFGVDTPLEVLTRRTNKSTSNEAYSSLMPTDVPTNISRIVTAVENYLVQEIPGLVMSTDDAAYDAKLQEIRDGLAALEYDTVRDFYSEAFKQSVAGWNAMNE